MKYLGFLGGCLIAIAWILILIIPGEPFARTPTHAEHEEFTHGWRAYDAGQFSEAFRIWEGLAERGHVSAQINLGAMCDDGRGVAEDPLSAVRWYRTAALQGNSVAQYNLGCMYEAGRGVGQDMAEAVSWYGKAAKQGLAIAQYKLGVLWSEGSIDRGSELQTKSQASRGQAPGKGGGDVDQDLAIIKPPVMGVAQNQERAFQWFYKSGLSYLEGRDSGGARRAVEAINKLVPGHALERQLQSKIHSSAVKTHRGTSPELFADASIGTAWPLPSGYVLTNNHVVSESTQVTLISVDGRELPARAILRDEANDIALLEVKDSHKLPPALPLATSQARLGSSVFTIGFPRVDFMGKTPKLSDGVISGVNGLHDDPGSYQTTVPIQPGNSGGPLLNMNGEVVGVVTSMLGVRDEIQGNSYVLPNTSCSLKIERVKDLLALLPHQGLSIKVLPRHFGNLETIADRVQGSVMIVVAK